MAADKLGTLVLETKADVARIQKDMGKIAKTLKRRERQWLKHASKLKAAFGAMISSLLLRKMVTFVKRSIDIAEALDKMSQYTGITVERLTGLKHAASMTGADLATLEIGLRRMSRNMSDTSEGIGTALKAFRALGIEVTDGNGKLRGTMDVVMDLADRMAMYADGAQKSAYATLLLGRGGSALIPLLNFGSKGIRKLTEENKALGAEITGKTSQAATLLIDDLARLQRVWDGISIVMSTKILPYLNAMAAAFLKSSKQGEHLKAVWNSLKAAMKVAEMGDANIKILKDLEGQYTLRLEAVDALSKKISEGYQEGWSGLLVKMSEEEVAALKTEREKLWDELSALDEQIEKRRRSRVEAAVSAPAQMPEMPGLGVPNEEITSELVDRSLRLSERLLILSRKHNEEENKIRAEHRDTLITSLADWDLSDEDRLGAKYQRELELLEGHEEAKEQLTRRHRMATARMDTRVEDQRAQASSQSWRAMASMASHGGKKLFAIHKAAQLAGAVVDMHRAVVGALAVPPIPNYTLARGARMAGLASIASIVASSIGGGSAGGSTPSGPSAAAPTPGGTSGAAPAAGHGGVMNLTFIGATSEQVKEEVADWLVVESASGRLPIVLHSQLPGGASL